MLEFQKRFIAAPPLFPEELSQERALQRIRFLNEELQEFLYAVVMHDLEAQVDALVDLVYFALGTAVEMGIPWERVWHEVHAANMRKEGGQVNGGKLLKPEGWVPPDVKGILAQVAGRPNRWNED